MKYLALLLASALTACGGGGGGSPTASTVSLKIESPIPAYNLQAGMTNLYRSGFQTTFSLSGSSNTAGQYQNLTGLLTLSAGGVVGAQFNSSPALQTSVRVIGTITLTDMYGNKSIAVNDSTLLMFNTNMDPVLTNQSTRHCESVGAGAYPTMLVSGQKGNITTYACYTDSSRITPTGEEKITYSTRYDPKGGLLVDITDTETDAKGSVTLVETDTYNLTLNNQLTLTTITVVGTKFGTTVNYTAQ